MRKIVYISRSALILLLALQVLNLSIASQAYLDSDYDYSYTYNAPYDPTETAVEWIVELNYGQQPAFSYDSRTDTNKNTLKSFHWQIGLPEIQIPVHGAPESMKVHFTRPETRILSTFPDTFSPPPEGSIA